MLTIKHYGGDPLEFADFLAEYFRYVAGYEWIDAEKLAWLPLHIMGIAAAIVTRLKPKQKKTWIDLVNNMKEKIIIGDQTQMQLNALASRKRRTEEQILSFAYALRTLAD